MILSAGPLDSVSFTDDASLDQRKTDRSKVSIHCQARRERPLDWYYSLLRRSPSKSGEIKSRDVIDTFFSLAMPEKRKVLRTLKFVRVNITDPRPYKTDLEAMLGSIIPGVSAKEFLVRLDQAEKRAAEKVRRKAREFVAQQMLWDSPSERLRLRHSAMTWFPEVPEWMTTGHRRRSTELREFDLTVFEDETQVNLNWISVFVSKSGSVFYPALDALDEVSEQLQWPATAWDFWGVHRALRDFHVFDDGNRKAITWVDHKRIEALSSTDPHSQLRFGSAPKALAAIDSKDSFFLQAADFAARIVTALWERQTLVEVARSFEYVTYNGRRIGEVEAAAITAKLSHISPP
jgi:hypothetical protein